MIRFGPIQMQTRRESLLANIREKWAAACAHDNIPISEPAVIVFSDGNPHLPAYEEAMREYLDYMKELKSNER